RLRRWCGWLASSCATCRRRTRTGTTSNRADRGSANWGRGTPSTAEASSRRPRDQQRCRTSSNTIRRPRRWASRPCFRRQAKGPTARPCVDRTCAQVGCTNPANVGEPTQRRSGKAEQLAERARNELGRDLREIEVVAPKHDLPGLHFESAAHPDV